jgi:hydroxymethylglutaryl-CoA lyase
MIRYTGPWGHTAEESDRVCRVRSEQSIRVFEVGPRDGLQNESILLPVQTKVELIERLAAAGICDIEIGSFVHPKWVPQMADTDEVATTLQRFPGVRYWGLVPNQRGLERAVACGLTHVAVFVSSSETHNAKNVNRTIGESLSDLSVVIKAARDHGLAVRAYISTVFGCPYEGTVPFERVLEIGEQLLSMGAFQVSLGDTTGMGEPIQVRECARQALDHIDVDQVALHLHDTRGLGLTNAFAGYIEGIRHFDSSVGGLGGCPYAPGAPGNLGTEALVGLMESMKVDTSVSLNSLRSAIAWLNGSAGFQLDTFFGTPPA